MSEPTLHHVGFVVASIAESAERFYVNVPVAAFARVDRTGAAGWPAIARGCLPEARLGAASSQL
jgi:hypothetical protein